MKRRIELDLNEHEADSLAFMIRLSIDQFIASKALRDRTKVSLKDLQVAEKVRRRIISKRD
ncbi:hypothetical protein [Larkinella soli]|uniref:hypothetical protein n=1 Tax=Larkinella soli TaxID=1770527 RepID=UPI000FFC53D1|nr:hypothetical protein [Larkinella soli]